MSQKCDVLIVGAGPGGYVSAIRAAQLGLNTVIVEKEPNNGGTCLNVGCIPSKTLLHFSEQFFHDKEKGPSFGLQFKDFSMQLNTLMQSKSQVISGLNMGIKGLLKKNKITRLEGVAKFISPNKMQVIKGDQTEEVEAAHIILATGSEPIGLPFLPFDEKKILSSTGALALSEVPKKMLVIGSGAIGLELGSVYQRLGSEVIFIELSDHIGGFCDPDIAKLHLHILKEQGMFFHLSTKVTNGEIQGDQVVLTLENSNNETFKEQGDVALVCVGRRPYFKELGLDHVDIKQDEKGRIIVDPSLRTNYSHIFAVGDLINGPMLAHKASEEGLAVVEFIANERPTVNYHTIPNVIYTSPESAGVGFTKETAEKNGLQVKVGSFSLKGNSRAHCIGETDGLVKIIAETSTHQIIGMHILSTHASELIPIGAIAIEQKMTAKQLAHICFPHPTFSEAIKEAALAVLEKSIHI